MLTPYRIINHLLCLLPCIRAITVPLHSPHQYYTHNPDHGFTNTIFQEEYYPPFHKTRITDDLPRQQHARINRHEQTQHVPNSNINVSGQSQTVNTPNANAIESQWTSQARIVPVQSGVWTLRDQGLETGHSEHSGADNRRNLPLDFWPQMQYERGAVTGAESLAGSVNMHEKQDTAQVIL